MGKSLSVVITFHSEGLLAHTALKSFHVARNSARAEGFDVELICVLDRADSETSSIVVNHPGRDGSERIVEVMHGDLALARNSGIHAANGDYVCTVDGDDLVSRRYFACHMLEAAKHSDNVILHPEMVVSFGMYNAFNWQVDQEGQYFDRDSLLRINPWISATFASRRTFESVPYKACFPKVTGFGYEDWYWNCETIAQGKVHRLAWGAVYLYRRKYAGSLNEASHGLRSVVPKTSLFEVGSRWMSEEIRP